MRYSDIKDIEGLDEARRQLSRKVDAKGKEVLKRYDDLREAYSPIGLMAAGIRSISGSIPFDKLILYGLRLIRRKFL